MADRMKNDGHVWDNKKPTAQMLGRWQPWHDGHQKLFEEILKKTGQVNIMVRDVQGVDDNPFDFETVKKNIEERLNPETRTVLEEAVGFTSLDSTVSGISHFGLSSHSLESQEHELSKKRDKKII